MNFINEMIEDKREEIAIYESGIFGIKDDIIIPAKCWREFKKLYKDAMSSKNPDKARKALKYYKENKNNIDQIILVKDKKRKMIEDLESIVTSDTLKKNKEKEKEEYNKKWAHRNGKKVTIAEIKSNLLVIVRRRSAEPKVKEKLKEFKAKLVVKYFDEEYKGNVIFEIIDGDQEARVELIDILYEIGGELEEAIPVSVDYGDGDEGCLYIDY